MAPFQTGCPQFYFSGVRFKMHLWSFASVLILCGPALAAPTKDRCPAGPNVPSPDSLGALQALNYNNLGAENNGTAAVLVYDRLTKSKAQDRCASIGETLFPFESAPEANRSELAYQLDYLVYAKDLRPDDDVWVAGNEGCLAYSQSKKQTYSAPCDSKLPAICTSRVPPTTELDRTVVASSKIAVKINEYTLTGFRDARSFRFIGVPFADPPVDELRLAPPRAYTGPKKIDATTFGRPCVQAGYDGNVSEDCLYLNVYTPILPARPGTVRRPVAVYFHGGAFVLGAASETDYDGGNFASRNDVVVVTVNYRLGALGFLATGNLTTGSYGIRDQILALEWVNKNIAAFGGDPAHVTIFGQSAGGQSVVAVLSSSAAQGLFSGAIVQSAPIDLPWYTRGVYSSLVVPHVADAVGCGNATASEEALLACLRSVPATSFLDDPTANTSVTSAIAQDISANYLHVSQLISNIEPYMPMIDDSGSGIIDDQFHNLLANNALPNRVPTMFTTVTDEAISFVNDVIPNLGSSQSFLDTIFELVYPPAIVQALKNGTIFPVDPNQNDSVRITGAEAVTYSEWFCPQAYLLRNAVSQTPTIFPALYEVEITKGHPPYASLPEICSPNTVYNATCHSNDILPIWGTLNGEPQGVPSYYNMQSWMHSQLLNDIFGSFFRSYDPNPDTEWLRVRGPAYASTYQIFAEDEYRIEQHDPHAETLALLGMPPSTTQNPGLTEKCAVFEDYGFTFENAVLTV
ncbi:Carboxylesterase family-domain-containing protein [Aspergillus granulosus]|uniref:Carboxylesterase family-domain-containing protein n=1 Tax=Aspergillus granulosus TaxID=176169 RepID=A0ABR4H9L7_9EURO